MEKYRKKIFLVVTLVIVGLLVSVSGSAMIQNSINEEKTLFFEKHKKIDFKPESAKAKILTKVNPLDKINTLDTPVFNGITPAVSNSESTMACAFYSLEEENIYHYFSLDAGETWEGGLGWMLDYPPELPSIDGCGDGRYIASFVPYYLDNEGGSMFRTTFDANDFEDTFDGGYWTWNDVGEGYTDFIDVEVAGYTSSDSTENEWAYGAHAMIGDHGELGSQTGFFSYVCTEDGTAWIYTLTDEPGNFNGATSCGIDIDQSTNFAYAAYNYDNDGTMEIYIFIMNFNTWGEYSGYPIHEEAYEAFLNTTGNDNVLDVSALNNNVIIVSERDGAIIAYYSDDGLNNINEIQIDSSGEQPRIVHFYDESAICSYIKNGIVYTSITEDGGKTWTSPSDNSEVGPVYSADISALGLLYEAEEIIYFATTDVRFPIIQLDSISGGIGVTAVIKNLGAGDAVDIPYKITATGGIFEMISKEETGEFTVLANDQAEIKMGVIFGIGAVTIEVTVGTISERVEGKQFLIFTKL